MQKTCTHAYIVHNNNYYEQIHMHLLHIAFTHMHNTAVYSKNEVFLRITLIMWFYINYIDTHYINNVILGKTSFLESTALLERKYNRYFFTVKSFISLTQAIIIHFYKSDLYY